MRLASTVIALGLLACAPPIVEQQGEPEPPAATPSPTPGDAIVGVEPEPVGEAVEPVTTCMAACLSIASFGCGGAVGACWFADAITLGTLIVPCAVFATAVCTAGGTSLFVCDSLCG